MNPVNSRPQSRRARLGRVAVGLALVSLPGGGCKHSGGGNSSDRPTTGATRGDPLLGMRLPPQDVPIGGKPEFARNGRDPLLMPRGESPLTENPTKQASTAAPGEVSSLPPRRNNSDDSTRRSVPAPYRPGLEASPSALAAGTNGDDTLSMGREPHGKRASESEYERAVRLLRDSHTTWTTPVRTKTGYAVTAKRSQSITQVGPVREYRGTGETPAAALMSVVEQVRDDRR
jgi:hypothetical protein